MVYLKCGRGVKYGILDIYVHHHIINTCCVIINVAFMLDSKTINNASGYRNETVYDKSGIHGILHKNIVQECHYICFR